jgi:hypothetical protein
MRKDSHYRWQRALPQERLDCYLRSSQGDLARHHQNLQDREGRFMVDLGLPKEKVREGGM